MPRYKPSITVEDVLVLAVLVAAAYLAAYLGVVVWVVWLRLLVISW